MNQPGRIHRRVRLWLLVLTVAVVPAAAGQSSDRSGDEPRPGDPEEQFVQTVARLRPSVVAVGTYDRQDSPSLRYFGTGFVIGDGLMVATNAHVVHAIRRGKRLDDLRVFFPDSDPRRAPPAAVVAEDRFHDVALLRFRGPKAPAMELAGNLAVPQGRSTGIIGYPIGTRLGLVPAVHRGLVAAVVPAVLPMPRGTRLTPELKEAIRDPYHLYQLDLVVFPGNSGSPLFEARSGRVIGIINKTLATRTREHLLTEPSGIAYAVPIRWVERLVLKTAIEQQQARGPAHDRTGSSGE